MKLFIFSPVVLLLTMVTLRASGQGDTRRSSYTREVGMTGENDIFFVIDYYYTAGHEGFYRRIVNPNGNLFRLFQGSRGDSAKVMVSYAAGFKIFNPRNIDSASTRTMDRPYAGWSYGRYSVTNFSDKTSGNRYEIEAGVVGKNSGMEKLQAWVHNALDFVVPKGWASQIRNEAVVNFYYNRYQEIKLANQLDFVSQSAAAGGTGNNKLSEDITVRALRFNPINNSSFLQSRLSWDTPDQGRKRRNEFFLFVSAGGDYVLSNIFLQGSIFKDHKSVFTVPVQRFIFRQSFGVMFSSKSVTWNITTVHLSRETPKGIDHKYGSLGMAVRF